MDEEYDVIVLGTGLKVDFFLINLVVCTVGAVWITVYPPTGLADLMEVKTFPSVPYSLVYIGIAVINFLLSVMLEMFLMDNTSVREKCREKVKHCLPSSQFKYAAIEQEIAGNPSWPPVSPSAVNLALAFQRLDSAHHVPKDLNTATKKEILDELIEDSDVESRSVKSLGQVTPDTRSIKSLSGVTLANTGHTQNATASYPQRQLSAEGGDYYTEPLLKSDSDVRFQKGETSVDDNGKFMTTL